MQTKLWDACLEHEQETERALMLFRASKQRFGAAAILIQARDDVEKCVARITRDERYVLCILQDEWREIEISIEQLINQSPEKIASGID